jgi:hypothetical protein
MSHITTNKVQLKNINKSDVQECVDLITKHHNIKLLGTNMHVNAMDGDTILADYAFQFQGDQYPIGVNITEDSFEIVGEHWNSKGSAVLSAWLKNYYIGVQKKNKIQEELGMECTVSFNYEEEEIEINAVGEFNYGH